MLHFLNNVANFNLIDLNSQPSEITQASYISLEYIFAEGGKFRPIRHLLGKKKNDVCERIAATDVRIGLLRLPFNNKGLRVELIFFDLLRLMGWRGLMRW